MGDFDLACQGLAVEQKRIVYFNKLKHECSKQPFVKNINSISGIFELDFLKLCQKDK